MKGDLIWHIHTKIDHEKAAEKLAVANAKHAD